MKATELRIGNYINYSKENVIVTIGDLAVLQQRENDKLATPYEPIPLTEEWLLKFGFKQQNEFYVISDDLSHYVELLNVRDEWYPWIIELPELSHESEQKVCIPYIQYVHQLQNLYFALTGEELKAD